MQVVEFQFIVVTDDHDSACQRDFGVMELFPSLEIGIFLDELRNRHVGLEFMGIWVWIFGRS